MRFSSLCMAAMLLLVAPRASAQDCTYEPDNLVDSFDAFVAPLWGCQQIFTNDMWDRFHFDEGDWDDGFGWNDACNQDQPLMRTFNALQFLAFSVTNEPTCSTNDSDNVATWAYCWSGEAIDELDAECGDGTERAWTSWTVGFQWTELYWPFFYDETVVQRAGTIYHEARHAHGWCDHQGGCNRNVSCDPNWANGCVGVGSGSGPGANAYQVSWLSWYLNTARPEWTSPGLAESAWGEANTVLIDGFGEDPGFRLASDGTQVKVDP